MRNKIFHLLSEEERRKKIKSAVKGKTKGCLNEKEINHILMNISLSRQYAISVYRDKDEFYRVLSITKAASKKFVPGHTAAETGRTPGEGGDPLQMAAVILHDAVNCRNANCLYIFIPKEWEQKGQNNE